MSNYIKHSGGILTMAVYFIERFDPFEQKWVATKGSRVFTNLKEAKKEFADYKAIERLSYKYRLIKITVVDAVEVVKQ